MKALIDGDILVYRMAWAVQKTVYQHKETGEFFNGKKKAKKWLWEQLGDDASWNDEDWDITDEIEPWSACQFLIDHHMEQIMTNCDAEEYQVFLSPSRTFRHDLATIREYKANRRPPPEYKDKAREHLTNYYNAEVGQNIEADDCLGLHQTTETIIASIDKDLLSIPGWHYDIVNQDKICIDLYEADQMFMFQLIAGDPTDNIQGIPGMGPAKAKNILAMFDGDHKGLVEEIRQLYDEHYEGFGEDALIETAQLVYILRNGDKPGEEQWRKLLA